MAADPAAILDVAALERQTGGDAALRGEIVRMFLEDCPQRVDAIGGAIVAGDAAALASSSHALKGSAAYLRAAVVRDRAADLERCGREGRVADAPAVFDALRTAVADLLPELQKLTLQAPMSDTTGTWLARTISKVNGVAGTVHVVDGDGLRLLAAVNIPAAVQHAVEYVPRGKGMAGIALHSGEPVQTCNLAEDATGNVQPGAKAVSARAAVAMPIRDASGSVVAVVGIAFGDEREIPDQEVQALMNDAASVVSVISSRTT